MLTATTALQKAHEVRDAALPEASDNDTNGRFPASAVDSLAAKGLLGLMVSQELGGSGLGPRAFSEVAAVLAEADPSLGMIYVMHVCASACFSAASANSPAASAVLKEMAAGKHLSTLAFSEKGSRSHFWAPVSQAGTHKDGLTLNGYKSWVTSAGIANSYVVSTQVPDSSGPTDTVLCWVEKDAPGVRVAGAWNAMGMRSNAAAPVTLEDCKIPASQELTARGAGFKAMLEVVLPLFCLGSASVSLGICRATVGSTIAHLKNARFEHLGASLGEALPNLRANLAVMQIATDGLAARLSDYIGHLEVPSEATMLRVLESKAAAAEVAIEVTQMGMRTCGGAAFSKHTSIERYFRDAQASAVMAPTSDVLREFIGKALLGIPLF